MFTFNLTNIFETFNPKKLRPKFFKSTFEDDYKSSKLPSPGEIKQLINKLSRCSNCQFLIFDNYWTDDVKQPNIRLCPTCGYKL